MQTVKDTVLEIKEIVFGQHNVDVERYALELSERCTLSFDDIKDMFNNLTLIYMNETNPKYNHTQKKIWSKGEDQLMHHYVELALKEKRENGKPKSKSVILEELNDIFIGRTIQSISFRYYETKRALNDVVDTAKEVSVTKEIEKPVTLFTMNEPQKDSEDILDMVINLVDNVETVGLDVSSLFKSLYVMSQRAVENSNIGKVEELEGKVEFLESELDKEKSKNEYLQTEVSKLIADFDKVKREIEYFDGLTGKQKLQQLQNFNRNIKYMVDKFGGVVAVGV